jgi:glycine cleavage system aminomethyltransferase T
MGYIPRSHAKPGGALAVEIRGKLAGAVIVKLPFYRRSG